jgi:hypothetical protein
MSSETSTESPASGSESLQPWQLFTLAGLLGATLVVFLARGQSPAAVIILSLLVFAAAAVGVAAIKTFVSLTGGASAQTTQVLGGRTRAALEREKTLVLRSIKELEFDRAMRKVSEKDFADMSGRLRARAAGLMRQLDAGTSYRQQIEQEVARRIGSKANVGEATAVGGSTEQDPPYGGDVLCASCNTANDADAKFCKACGSKLESAS